MQNKFQSKIIIFKKWLKILQNLNLESVILFSFKAKLKWKFHWKDQN